MNIEKIGVIGAGTMGAGIAQVFAQNGFSVILFDLNEKQLNTAKENIEKNLQIGVDKGKLSKDELVKAVSNIAFVDSIEKVKADFIIEAIVEKLEIKIDVFQKLAINNSLSTILASNTSSISITKIAKEIPNPSRVVGVHFFNPAHLMKLVEIVKGAETDASVIDLLVDLITKIGKTSVICKNSPGFIVNRVARHYYVESLKILEENVSSIENIDNLLESAGFKMGPFKLMDTIGNDINFAVTNSLFESFNFDSKFRPSQIQEQKVDAGHLGKKSGKGFYSYSN